MSELTTTTPSAIDNTKEICDILNEIKSILKQMELLLGAIDKNGKPGKGG